MVTEISTCARLGHPHTHKIQKKYFLLKYSLCVITYITTVQYIITKCHYRNNVFILIIIQIFISENFFYLFSTFDLHIKITSHSLSRYCKILIGINKIVKSPNFKCMYVLYVCIFIVMY